MIARLLLLCALLVPGFSHAVTLYYSKCDTGAHASCVPGNDSNDGLSAASPKLNAPTGTQINAAACGDVFRLAQGGRWNGYTAVIDSSRNCATNPVVIEDYAPSSGATGKPRLHYTGTDNVLRFGGYNNTTPDSGYMIKGIHLSGVNGKTSHSDYNAETVITMFGTVTHVTFDNVEIEGGRLCIYISPRDDSVTPVAISHVMFKNSNIHGCFSMGFLGAAHNLSFINNDWSDINYSGSGFNHALYFGGSPWSLRNILVRNNRFTNISRDQLGVDAVYDAANPGNPSDAASGICEGGNLTVHAEDLEHMVIEDNLIYQADSAQTCYGISVTTGYGVPERHSNVIIRRNRIVNLGECAICFSSLVNGTIENNEVTNLKTDSVGACIFATPNTDVAQNNNVIRNNSCYIADPGEVGFGVNTINLNEGGVTTSSGNVIANNLTIFGTGNRGECYWAEAGSSGVYSYYNYNWCYATSLTTFRWSIDYTSLASAQAQGYDVNGVMGTNPQLIEVPSSGNGWRIRLSSGSPAKTAGILSHCARTNSLGQARTGGTCEIGAATP